MALKATCPNDPTHEYFVTVAYVSEDWIVDSAGNFQDVEHRYPWEGERQVLHRPDPGNIWTCRECGAAAKVTVT